MQFECSYHIYHTEKIFTCYGVCPTWPFQTQQAVFYKFKVQHTLLDFLCIPGKLHNWCTSLFLAVHLTYCTVSMHFLSVDSAHLCFTLYTVHGDVLVLNLVAGYCDNKESQIIAMVRPKMWTQKHPCSHSVISCIYKIWMQHCHEVSNINISRTIQYRDQQKSEINSLVLFITNKILSHWNSFTNS